MNYLFLAFASLNLILWGCTQQNTTQVVNETPQQTSIQSELDEVVDFFNRLNSQYRSSIAPYVDAIERSEVNEEPLEEGSEAPSPTMDANVHEMAEMARRGLDGISLLTNELRAETEKRIQSAELNEEDISLGSALLGSGVGLSLEWFEFPESLHKTLEISQEGSRAQFDVLPASDHYNYSPNAVIRLNLVRQEQGWLLSSIKYVLH